MKTISVLEFRKNVQKIIQLAQQGQRMTMTYRGKPVCVLEPIREDISEDDPFYKLDQLAEKGAEDMSNKDIDRIIYEDNIC